MTYDRKKLTIGSNIRAGRTPGGMYKASGEGSLRRPKRGSTVESVNEAANDTLKRLGVNPEQQPDSFRDATSFKKY